MGNTDLDWQLRQAIIRGDAPFTTRIADLRWELNIAAQAEDWQYYNDIAQQLNKHGATIALQTVPIQETEQMGMFDKPQFLTGKESPFVQPGEKFWLHNARLDGMTNTPNGQREQVKLLVSHERDGEKMVVYTSGAGIVNQVKRMDNSDRAAMPFEVRLDQVPSGKGSPTNVITPADQDPPTGVVAASNGSTGDDF